jgi:simple sugar transport system substrate-binding protein
MNTLSKAAGLGLAVAAGIVLFAGSASAAADTSCTGKRFVFFPGGGEGDAFATIVYNGAKLAAQQTGCHVDYVWSDWNPQKMVQQMSEAIARKPTGIAIMGHPGDEALDPLIDRARKAGIIVTAQNVELSKAEEKYKADGFGYVGAELYKAGWTDGEATIKDCGLKSGDEVLVWGLLGQPGRGERTKGAKEALEKAGMKVDYLEISDEINKDTSAGIPVFSSFAASHPNLKAMITDHGVLTATVPAFMKAANKKPGAICAGGFDLSEATVQGIKEGYIAVVLDQQPFLQGYLPIMQLYLTSKFGFAGLHIDTGAALITKENVDPVAALAKEAIR